MSSTVGFTHFVIFPKLVTLLLGAAAADRAHVDQAVAELNEGATFHWQSERGHVAQGKVNESLQFLFTHVVLDALQSDKGTSRLN
ncbi:hypothetical protein E2C01_037268 [Portunus trituberculatus]|uniref:Uncharacterized protein n=1 Tax=Portunus trituberculatus TaxID=210409 RepID=A0A5B7FF65_PORTR|nr:hypothetical protein [Portunus trituberculatus]